MPMPLPRRFALAALALTLPGLEGARADFYVCNDSFDVVNVAVGDDSGGTIRTRGWWTIGPNRCATVIRGRLDARFLYVFATDVFGQELLDGDTELCVLDGRFDITGGDDCWERGHIGAPFLEIDTGDIEGWTLFLGDTPS